MPALRGTFWILILYDICEEIRLDEIRKLIRAEPAAREPTFTRPAPEYVRFERPPAIEPLPPITLESKPYSMAQIAADATLTSILGRMAYQTKREVSWEEMLRSA